MAKSWSAGLSVVILGIIGLATSFAQENADPKGVPTALAGDSTGIAAGHSLHGEAFNQGPRQRAHLMGGTGPVRFPVTTKHPDVQKFVEQGIGQVHGFWYFEAERSFRQAAMLDPECAIAYWGMAMANVNNATRAKAFIAEAVKRKSQAGRLETLLIEQLHDELNSKASRDVKLKSRVEALRAIVAEFPNELEPKAFLGLALYNGRTSLKLDQNEVDKTLNEVLAVEPLHPVHHYRVHLWDSKDSSKALNSAALCGQSSPSIAHMWHMPGHTFSKLQRYDDAAWQQEASARVDHANMMRDRVLPDQIHNFAHNNEWLIRDLTYIGRWQDAADLAKNMTELPQHPKYNSFSRGSGYYGRMRLFDVLSRFELWEQLVELCHQPCLPPTDSEPEQVKRLRHLGIAQARSGHPDEARVVLAELDSRLAAAKEKAAKTKTEPTKTEPAKTEQPKPEASANENPKSEPSNEEPPKKSDEEPENKESENKEPSDEQPKPSRPSGRRPGATPAKNPFEHLEKAIAAVQGHLAFAANDFAGALPLLRKAGEDALVIARTQALAGEHDAAIKAVEASVKTQVNRVQPLAVQIEILSLAGKKEYARKAFERLRGMSRSIQMGSPVFDRLAPIAAEFGYPTDWRIVTAPPADVGERPDLDSLGPFRWQPMPAQEWSLPESDGRLRALKDFQGRPVVVIFYLGYGCLHCAEQLQSFAASAAEFRAAGIDLIAISTDNRKDLQQSLDNYKAGMPFPLVSDESLEVFKAWRAFDDFENVPLHGTFLVDGHGLVRWQDISFEPFNDPKFVLKESQRLLGLASSSVVAKTTTPAAPVVPAAISPDEATKALHAIRNNGINGSLVLSGSGTTPSAAITTLLNLAKQKQARVVVLQGAVENKRAAGGISSTLTELLTQWFTVEGRSMQVFRVGQAADATDSEMLAALTSATCVWFEGGSSDQWLKLLSSGPLGEHCQQLLQRGGVAGGSAAFASVVGSSAFKNNASDSPLNTGLGWLPGTLFELTDSAKETNRLAGAINNSPQLVGVRLGPDSALTVRGRFLQVVGESPVQLELATSATYPVKNVQLNDRNRTEDLTALRRFAVQRLLPRFPSEKPAPPIVEKGTLIIVGGGGTPKGLMSRFVKLAGGEAASIVVIPISMPDPLPERDGTAELFRREGAKEVTVLKSRTPQDVDRPENLDVLRRVTGIWFGGGRQWHFIDAYEGTQAAALMHDVLKRDGVIAGSSAGASIQGEYMARGNPLGPNSIMADGYERGLGFLNGVAIDQHFTQRNRLPDMTSLMKRYPQLLGIGIDESTAIVVQGSIAEIVGRGRVCFYDRNKPIPTDGPDFEFVFNDGKYELVKRQVLEPGKLLEPEKPKPETKPGTTPDQKPDPKPAVPKPAQ